MQKVNDMKSRRGVFAVVARILALAVALAGSACLGPKLEGHKIRSDEQEAMPYYLPKPYLLVTKNFNLVRTSKKTTTTTRPDGTKIQVVEEETGSPSADPGKLDPKKTLYAHQIVYLPDRCNLYGLKISRGIGTLDSKIEIEDGWKFTGTALKTDSKTPETIEAIGRPIAEIGMALLRRDSGEEPGEDTPAAADVALYDLFTGQCVFAWPGRDSCAAPTQCPAR